MACLIRSTSSALSWLLLVSLAAAPVAVAQKKPSDEKAARALFADGQKAYDLGEFDRALTLYSDAYKLKALPGFLFNIAQCRGCCSGDRCVNTSCGSAGNVCQRCEGIGNNCSLNGRCTLNTCTSSQGQCCSATGMVSAQWPTCTSTSGDCIACDTLRSNACRTAALNQSPCGCGTTAQCPLTQLCLLINGVPTCR